MVRHSQRAFLGNQERKRARTGDLYGPDLGIVAEEVRHAELLISEMNNVNMLNKSIYRCICIIKTILTQKSNEPEQKRRGTATDV